MVGVVERERDDDISRGLVTRPEDASSEVAIEGISGIGYAMGPGKKAVGSTGRRSAGDDHGDRKHDVIIERVADAEAPQFPHTEPASQPTGRARSVSRRSRGDA